MTPNADYGGRYLVPDEESLAIIGPFPDGRTAAAFYRKYMDGLGADVRDSATPEDWIAVYKSEQEDEDAFTEDD
jgi:hypothetical protein